jgi:GNAT superfamily N-acetyltransferase
MTGILRQAEQWRHAMAGPAQIPPFDFNEDVFAGQASQYGPGGKPGINHERHHVGEIPIDCLLHRDTDSGEITGILNFFPKGTLYEKPGAMTVLVHPRHQGKGIGKALVGDAIKRWKVDLDAQQYTPDGYRLYESLTRKAPAKKAPAKPKKRPSTPKR